MALFLGRHAQTSTHSKEGTETGQCMDTTKGNDEPGGFIGVIYKTMDEGLIREQKELQTASRVGQGHSTMDGSSQKLETRSSLYNL